MAEAKASLTAQLADQPEPLSFDCPEHGRGGLSAAVYDAGVRFGASHILRSPMDKIVARPDETAKGLKLDLHGNLAQILGISIAAGGKAGSKTQKTASEETVDHLLEYLVAGAGFEPAAFRL